ncbi:hypothetical protein [Yinghuangia sp. YIM S09857]|uniref:hypothetical protein n=1 Tax=Yinghuangia sp. YIM S09857 TaxID=3436929 RepID=UPI003F53112F
MERDGETRRPGRDVWLRGDRVAEEPGAEEVARAELVRRLAAEISAQDRELLDRLA